MSTPTTSWAESEAELSRLLLENVRDHAVFALDTEGRVLSWCAPAEQLLGYREQEVVGQLADRFYLPEDLADGVPARERREALETGRAETERWHVRKDGSRFWSHGVTTPLRGAGGALHGFARVMRDRSELKRAEDARSAALAYAEGIVETVREPLVVLDGRLRVQSANRAFYRTFAVSPRETEGHLLYELGNRQWDIPRLRPLLEEVLPQDKAFNDFEVERDFPGVGRKVMRLNARVLQGDEAATELILLAIEDVTERRQAEENRRELETRFTSLVKNIKDHALFTLDAQGRVTSWNVAAEQVLGYTEAEVMGRHFSFIFTPEDRRQDLPEAELRTAREEGRAEDERWHLRKDGERFWALGIVSALHDAEGRPNGFAKILRDMTAWKRAEAAQRESAAKYCQLFESIDEAFCIVEVLFDGDDRPVDYRFLETNPAFERHTGIRSGVGRRMRDIAADHEEHWYQVYGKVAATGEPVRFQSPAQALGRFFDVYAFRIGAPEQRRVAILFNDITGKQRTEMALRDSEARFRALTLAGSDVVYRMSADWSEMRSLRGRAFIPDTRAPSRSWLDRYIPPGDQPRVCDAIDEAVRTKRPFELEHRVLRVDGRPGWTFSRAVPLLDERGEIREWFGAASDVTRRREAEEALRQSEARYRLLHEHLRDAFVEVSVDGRFLECNALYRKLLGYSSEELGALRYQDLTPERWHAFEARVVREQILTRGYSDVYEKEYRRKDGTIVPVELRTILSRDAAGQPSSMWALVRDISARKRAEEQMQADAARLAAVLDAEREIAGLSLDDTALLERILGHTSQLIGAEGACLEMVEGDELVYEAATGLAADFIGLRLKPAGSLSGLCLTTGALQRTDDSEHDPRVDRAACRRIGLRSMIVLPLRHGADLFGVLKLLSPRVGAFDAATEQVLGLMGEFLGATIARRRAQQALREANRRKDEFLAILAHELRNPLAPLRTGWEILQLATATANVRSQALGMMGRQIDQLVHLVDDLLDLSRVTQGRILLRREPVRLADLLGQAVETNRALLDSRGHRLELDIPDDPLLLEADPLRLTQVFANLLTNAAKYTNDGGRITLRLAREAGEAVVTVADTGVGISPALLPRIFDIFVQDHTQGQGGLGIGLHLVQQLVALHGGRVEAHSAGEGRGSTFIVRLPRAAPVPAGAGLPGAESASGPARGGRRLLIIDDNKDAADSLGAMLDLLGHETRTAHSGLAGLEMAADFRPEIILLDLGMPGLDGYATATRIRAAPWGQAVRLVALTGWGQDEDRRRTRAAGFDQHLVKPVDAAALAAVLT